MSDLYLVHHGIKGQKWGVRRFQNEDGSVTPAGALRYYGHNVGEAKARLTSEKERYKAAVRKYNRDTGGGSWATSADINRLTLAKKKLNWSKEDVSNEKAKKAISSETKISKRRQKLEQQYRDRGMSEEEAAVAAYKRAKVEKILAISGAVAVAGLAAYGAYKYNEFAKDRVLEMGTPLSRIASDGSTGNLHEGFYAVLDKHGIDKMRYGGIYGSQMKANGKDVFRKSMELTGSVKVASPKNQIKVLQDIARNDNRFRGELLSKLKGMEREMVPMVNATPKQTKAVQKAIESLQKGVIDKNVQEAFNLGLMDHSNPAYSKFVAGLKKMGYGAIQDVNDKKLSGFATKDPLIIFDAGKAAVTNVEKLSIETIAGENVIANGANMIKNSPKLAAVLGAGIGAIGLANKVQNSSGPSKTNDKLVAEYRKEHPNTELSYTEIVRMMEEEKLK